MIEKLAERTSERVWSRRLLLSLCLRLCLRLQGFLLRGTSGKAGLNVGDLRGGHCCDGVGFWVLV